MVRPTSLRMRAISLLSHREHSRVELRRKLLSILRSPPIANDKAGLLTALAGVEAEQSSATAAATLTPQHEHVACKDGIDHSNGDDSEACKVSAASQVDDLLQWLQEQGYLDEVRFIDSRVHARSRRFGSLRIAQELAQHGLNLSIENQIELKSTEFARARAVWQRKFDGQVPEDAAARAKQMRFLMARGFGSDVIRRVLRSDEE